MRRELGIFAAGATLVLTGLATGAAAQTPPIFQPGAPGQPSRVVSPEEARALGRTTYTAGDVLFMQHMIVHHAQAVEMVELLKTQGADPTVARLGLRIAMSQEAEIALMREWLADRGQPEAPAAGHAGMDHAAMGHGGAQHGAMDHAAMGHGAGGHAAGGHAVGGHAGHDAPAAPDPQDVAVMAGMLTPRQMQTLAAARGREFDRLFLTGMIQHHQGALDMVDDLMAQPNPADDTMLSEFVNAVVADQSAEILRMQSLLSEF